MLFLHAVKGSASGNPQSLLMQVKVWIQFLCYNYMGCRNKTVRRHICWLWFMPYQSQGINLGPPEVAL